jgi:hypothetical protein
MAARVRERQKAASTPLYRAALIAGNSDVKAGAALSAAHWPAPSGIAPVTAETVNQHVHVKRAKAVAMGAPCADAAMAVDKIAEIWIVVPVPGIHQGRDARVGRQVRQCLGSQEKSPGTNRALFILGRYPIRRR